jgi:hypothetical protein
MTGAARLCVVLPFIKGLILEKVGLSRVNVGIKGKAGANAPALSL